MLKTLSDLEADAGFDYCVIGSGPAGITLARALAQKANSIALLEAGSLAITPESQQFYEGRVAGDPYFKLHESRARCFGGSSLLWNGMCRPLDTYDYVPKPGIPLAHWPLAKADLDPYLPGAREILELEPVIADQPLADSGLIEIDFKYSPPVRFSMKYESEIKASSKITLIPDAPVYRLEVGDGGIQAAVVKLTDGSERTIRARQFILAAGGIENSRLLLWFNRQTNNQVVKTADALGRYWMEHPHFTVGEAIVDTDAWPFIEHPWHGTNRTASYIAPGEALMREAGILNGALHIYPIGYEGTKKLIADIACVAPDLGRWFIELTGRNLACGARIRGAWEQEPSYESHIALDDTTDSLGIPKPVLYWHKTERDLKTIRVLSETLGTHMAKHNLGRTQLFPFLFGEEGYPENAELAGYHHMGGTRMATDPKLGIVDDQCKVHGQDNLYVAGSSVFPTGGHANPTLTIVQLALRLADHLMTKDA